MLKLSKGLLIVRGRHAHSYMFLRAASLTLWGTYAFSNMKSALRRYADHVRMNSPRSRRLGFIAGYYRLTAVLSGLSLATTLAVGATQAGLWAAVLAHPVAFVSWPVSIATSWWTGELIGERQRFGAWIAVGSIGLGVLSQLAHHTRASASIVVAGAIGLAAIASIWKELE